MSPPHEILCVACRQPFVPKRTDARTCSGRCRQRAHRGRLLAPSIRYERLCQSLSNRVVMKSLTSD
jgi:hypothetical protein